MLQNQVLALTNEVCKVLAHMQCVGIAIDQKALKEIEDEYRIEHDSISRYLRDTVFELMGTDDYNLNSPDDLSAIIYSIRVTDKKNWKKVFGIGTDDRGKKNRVKIHKDQDFKNVLRTLAELVHKVDKVENCHVCHGVGKVDQYKKDGDLSKRKGTCNACGGVGYLETMSPKVAGLGVRPQNKDVAAAGFSTSADTLEEIMLDTEDELTKEFLSALLRYNAISTYLSTFIGGIKKGICYDGLLRPEFIQTSTKTGRLSSRNPNFQNQPRGNTFPVRKCVVSRFKGGRITEVDHAQLEFRVAVELSGDKQGIQDIKDKIDKHKFTADMLGVKRQDAKAHTFKPLYGGLSGSEKEKAYYKAFLKRHEGIAAWHIKLQDEAVANKCVVAPTGRVFYFPYAQRTKYGGSTQKTQIVNYPVQGVATADIVPLALMLCHNELEVLRIEKGIKSLIINTVHDSLVFDVYPGEEKEILELIKKVYGGLNESIKKFFGFDFKIPLDFEVKTGYNWMEMEVVYESNLGE